MCLIYLASDDGGLSKNYAEFQFKCPMFAPPGLKYYCITFTLKNFGFMNFQTELKHWIGRKVS